jgi:hypothetical protein
MWDLFAQLSDLHVSQLQLLVFLFYSHFKHVAVVPHFVNFINLILVLATHTLGHIFLFFFQVVDLDCQTTDLVID